MEIRMNDEIKLKAARAVLDGCDRLGQPAKLAPDTLRWLIGLAEEAVQADAAPRADPGGMTRDAVWGILEVAVIDGDPVDRIDWESATPGYLAAWTRGDHLIEVDWEGPDQNGSGSVSVKVSNTGFGATVSCGVIGDEYRDTLLRLLTRASAMVAAMEASVRAEKA